MNHNVSSDDANRAILRSLPLSKMDERHQGLSHALAESYLEAARVCLDRHHVSPQEFTLNDDNKESEVLVQWDKSDERAKGAWANNDDATRDGAYACALAATELSRDYVAVKRAERLTGADYYVAPNGSTVEDLEDYYRLEVSGTHLDSSSVRSRLRSKVEQAQDGQSNLPALAAVVGFKARLIKLERMEKNLQRLYVEEEISLVDFKENRSQIEAERSRLRTTVDVIRQRQHLIRADFEVALQLATQFDFIYEHGNFDQRRLLCETVLKRLYVEDGKITRAPEYNAPFAIIARANGSGAVTNGGARVSIGRTFTTTFALVY